MDIHRKPEAMLDLGPTTKIKTREMPLSRGAERSWVYLLLVLTVAYVLNFVDRQVVNILAEPIKRDLGLQDWQLGAMTGLSFALVYGLMALPIARLAERVNRARLIAVALLVWSGSTLLCGAAHSFGQLAAARVAVGIGEAGYTPSAHSLITQTVPKARRTLAFAIFGTGLPLGSMVALAIGGLVADIWGWRAAFLLAGLPGLVVAIVIFVTIPDTRTGHTKTHAIKRSNFSSDARALLGKRSFRLFVVASGLFTMSSFGMQAFIVSFFMRLHGDQLNAFSSVVQRSFGVHLGPTAIIGPPLGVIIGVAGIGSALIGGVLTDLLVRRDVRYFSWNAGIPLLLAAPVLVSGLLMPSLGAALACVMIFQILAGLGAPAVSSCIQSLAPTTMRATASAMQLLVVILLGNGLGPFSVGLTSDLIASAGYAIGPALRIALVFVTIPLLGAATLFLLAGRHLAHDLIGE